ncbi:hypothetical protein BKA91DRAFT_28231 [Yarrowia lipolytica]|nr:hypothetical protein BKA91DRAFT_28231 [Yarrowia lipolytica]KAE8171583.1 hypothetical protein BKA90DRAFT_25506 [Yarrowia lipolytica]RMJ00950.1 hypothetical protein BD777DRAFT_2496 [Yarrowia lipolytica]
MDQRCWLDGSGFWGLCFLLLMVTVIHGGSAVWRTCACVALHNRCVDRVNGYTKSSGLAVVSLFFSGYSVVFCSVLSARTHPITTHSSHSTASMTRRAKHRREDTATRAIAEIPH